eukprot:CAMPEP_0116967468 /NCGR_PEP_ID=MMETSP0467-20121206/50569_1 /TAXON_ID=283647 /ORGANISM="Mesodinium pulex, Strain SPMC105" /LENGTH=172 /DNA_ID=CAMNT_0004657383 /DNA_START=260 /DNA_END=778 /DNA_ORIENTATION=+
MASTEVLPKLAPAPNTSNLEALLAGHSHGPMSIASTIPNDAFKDLPGFNSKDNNSLKTNKDPSLNHKMNPTSSSSIKADGIANSKPNTKNTLAPLNNRKEISFDDVQFDKIENKTPVNNAKKDLIKDTLKQKSSEKKSDYDLDDFEEVDEEIEGETFGDEVKLTDLSENKDK